MTILRIDTCGSCNLWGGSEKTTLGIGNEKSKVFIVGESPGKTEIDNDFGNKPFVGFSGGILNWALSKAGFYTETESRYERAYFTNAVKCYPSIGHKRNVDSNKVSIDGSHVKICSRKWLHREITNERPNYILALGKHAYSALTGEGNVSIENVRGFWREIKINGRPCLVFPTLHPAFVLRNGDKTSTFYRDIETFTKVVRSRENPISQLGKHYQILTKLPAVRALFKKLKTKKRIAWDCETRNVRNGDPEWFPLGMSYCWKTGNSAYVPLFGKEKKEIWSKEEYELILKWTKDLLENPNIKKDGQNIKYDVNVARHLGIEVHGIDWDTMQAHHLFDETTFTNLTFLTSWYRLGFPRYENEIRPYVGSYKSSRGTVERDYSTIPLPILGKYACADVDAVWRIRRIQKREATKRIRDLYYNISTEMSKSAAEMEWNGVRINIPRIKDMEKEYEKKINEINVILSESVKLESFNVNSTPQMQHVLFGDDEGCLNLTQEKNLKLKKTKTGNLSTDKEVFELIRRSVKKKRVLKILDLIQEVRQMRKMKSTYLTGFKKIVDVNNRVHTSYLTTGTVTGRYASEGPNLQNIPRDPIFRSLFIAGPGRKMIPADYSQIEARLIAWLANEVKYVEKFANPEFDPHTYISSIVRKKPEKEVTKEQRSYDKAVTFGLNYGRSNKSIAETYDLPQKFVDEFVTEYFKELKMIKKWRTKQIKISKQIREDGSYYLQSNTGRRRHFFAYEWMFSEHMKEVKTLKKDAGDDNTFALDFLIGTMERQALNFKIQSYASDLLTMATAKIRKRIKEEKLDAFLVLSVHDMIALDSSETDVTKATKILEQEMPFTKTRKLTKTDTLKLHFPIDYAITDHWVQ